MSKVNGQMRTCDRCGATVFLKCIGEGERDGGFTRWNVFEDAPKGWSHYTKTGDLCPDCCGEYTRMCSDFERQCRALGFERKLENNNNPVGR